MTNFMKKLIAILLLSISAFGTTITGVKDVKYTNGNSFTGKIILGLNVAGAQDSCTGTALVQGTITINVMNGSVVGSPTVPDNVNCVLPNGTVYLASWRDSYNIEKMSNAYSITGTTWDIGAAVPLPITTSNVAAQDLLGIRSLTVTGTSTLANVTVGSANTLSVNNIKQQAGTGFNIFDPSGGDHFFISSSPPYTNTFLGGNGAGTVFLGSAAKASVADTTGTITTAGGFLLQTTSQTLPNTFANDASGGFLFTTNGGKLIQFTNGGVLNINNAATGTSASLTAGGTAAGTGGISIFNGAPGAANEMLEINPADGSTAATRMFALSIRGLSAGFLTGAQTFGITNAGLITGASFGLGIAQGGGFKHQRFGATNATAASAGATSLTTYTWTSPFADPSYTVVCTGTTQTNTAAGPSVESITASNFAVRVTAITAAAASFGGVDCIAAHD